jgi:preprotein translocase subunit SecD
MNRRNTNWLILILVLLALSLWVDLSKQISIVNPFNSKPLFTRNVDVRLGLDLRGGLQTLLEADLPTNSSVSSEDLAVTRQILESRANALGVSEVVMQTAGERRIVAEFPGVSNPEEVVASLQQTGLLEFVDMGTTPVDPGTVIKTDFAQSESDGTAPTTATPEATTTADPSQPTPTTAPDQAAATPQATPPTETTYHTVMTGADLKEAHVSTNQAGQPAVSFTLSTDGTKIFADYTSAHTNQYLGIVLDKTVISAPVVKNPITDGQGIIEGGFNAQSANELAIQLRYGSLPVPVKVVESRTIGATLGEESVRKSLLAGMIGLGVVILFMLLYYRLPGFIADLALIVYALLSLALFKFIPVVLTLPGIAGFILSIGMAVDANILIFERLKEELRAGRNLRQAIDLGWSRAWPSIRDSNTSTLITCLILYIFGNTFGASMVKGFSITLALGVVVSLFTAIIVTRTFLHTLLDNMKLADHPRWFGLGDTQ